MMHLLEELSPFSCREAILAQIDGANEKDLSRHLVLTENFIFQLTDTLDGGSVAAVPLNDVESIDYDTEKDPWLLAAGILLLPLFLIGLIPLVAYLTTDWRSGVFVRTRHRENDLFLKTSPAQADAINTFIEQVAHRIESGLGQTQASELAADADADPQAQETGKSAPAETSSKA